VPRHCRRSRRSYAPQGEDCQTPHHQDESDLIASGSGWVINGDLRHPFQAGDVLLVLAGIEQRFRDYSEDVATWVVFGGPRGGEQDNA
jgi:mannose-6-phosphate isomerase-like protein (cupin superfamily)